MWISMLNRCYTKRCMRMRHSGPMPPRPTLQSLGHTLLPTIFTTAQLAPLIPLTSAAV